MTYSELSIQDNPILVLNGAEHFLQVLLANRDQVFFYQKMFAPRQGMKFLPLSINMALESLNLKPQYLRGIACVKGPGYFTGLRVVLSIAVGIFCGAGVPLASLNYLYLIAKTAIGSLKSSEVDKLWVLTYAKKEMVNLQGFEVSSFASLCEPLCVSLEDALSLITTYSQKPAIVGSGVRKFYDFFTTKIPASVILSEKFDIPSKEVLWLESLSATYKHKPIIPLYLRPSDAEANLKKIKLERGL